MNFVTPSTEYNGKQVIPFFGRTHPFSNFFPATFDLWGFRFSCSEQAYTYIKAWYFKDEYSITQIMEETYPHKIKRLGRTIKNFNRREWNSVSEEYMFQILTAKFTQNRILAQDLINTKRLQIIEVNPYDSRWGCALSIDQLKAGKPFKGENLMGKLLEEVRKNLKISTQNKPNTHTYGKFRPKIPSLNEVPFKEPPNFFRNVYWQI
ncbi:unnamed protein product [Meloidogyne enterolobii]|uniref:Uncharacterized protein n=1 Tax=Meloidogyne enterolobii TaxID=390850 RepID=A0ACB0YSC3_MELEN